MIFSNEKTKKTRLMKQIILAEDKKKKKKELDILRERLKKAKGKSKSKTYLKSIGKGIVQTGKSAGSILGTAYDSAEKNKKKKKFDVFDKF